MDSNVRVTTAYIYIYICLGPMLHSIANLWKHCFSWFVCYIVMNPKTRHSTQAPQTALRPPEWTHAWRHQRRGLHLVLMAPLSGRFYNMVRICFLLYCGIWWYILTNTSFALYSLYHNQPFFVGPQQPQHTDVSWKSWSGECNMLMHGNTSIHIGT